MLSIELELFCGEMKAGKVLKYVFVFNPPPVWNEKQLFFANAKPDTRWASSSLANKYPTEQEFQEKGLCRPLLCLTLVNGRMNANVIKERERAVASLPPRDEGHRRKNFQ